MDNMYKLRIADRLLARKLAGKGAVLIEGPKWCGKTTTARQLTNGRRYLNCGILFEMKWISGMPFLSLS